MFEIEARVYDLQVSHDEMHRLKWGLYRDLLYQAKHFKEYQGEETFEDFLEKNALGIAMHEWITTVLEYGQMHTHERLLDEARDIINWN